MFTDKEDLITGDTKNGMLADEECSMFDFTENSVLEDAESLLITEDYQIDETEDLSIAKWRPAVKIAIVAVTAVVILFGFVWEAVYSEAANKNSNSRAQYSGSAIQDELEMLDWVNQELLPVNEYSRSGRTLKNINGIVIHYIGNPNTTAKQNRDYFANLATTREAHLSSNFIIGLNGEIVQCVPVDEIAYASNDRNADTLSIEMCHPDETGRFTKETYDAAVRLTAWLCNSYGLGSDDVIRHYDVTGKGCPRYFVDNEDAWEFFKDDVAQLIQ